MDIYGRCKQVLQKDLRRVPICLFAGGMGAQIVESLASPALGTSSDVAGIIDNVLLFFPLYSFISGVRYDGDRKITICLWRIQNISNFQINNGAGNHTFLRQMVSEKIEITIRRYIIHWSSKYEHKIFNTSLLLQNIVMFNIVFGVKARRSFLIVVTVFFYL